MVTIALGATLCSVPLLGLFFPGPPPGVTLDNFRRLRQGMTEQEVEAHLGGPGKRVGTGPAAFDLQWESKQLTVFVTLHPGSGTVLDAWAYPAGGVSNEVGERIRWDTSPLGELRRGGAPGWLVSPVQVPVFVGLIGLVLLACGLVVLWRASR
jgi:hypothetical protein